MSLKDDPKVQELITKAVDKAVKTEQKRCIAAAKSATDEVLAELGDNKQAVKVAKQTLKNVLESIKLKDEGASDGGEG